MAFSFAEMKAARERDTEKLLKQLDTMGNKGGNRDDGTWWQPVIDKAGNGSAVFRWLPAPPGEDFPYVKWWDHGFKGPGGWYIENSLQSIGQNDPVSEMNFALWAQGENSEGRKRVRGTGIKGNEDEYGTKRRLHYAANIYIMSHPARREDEGKVFRYKFGPKIFDKIDNLMHPPVETIAKINPFDLWGGCPFQLVVQKIRGQRNYDASEFIKPPVPLGTDDEMEEIWRMCHPLAYITEPGNYKSYNDLKQKLDRVMGGLPSPGSERDDSEPPARDPVPQRAAAPQRAPVKEEDDAPWNESKKPSTDEDDPTAYFARLVDADV